MQDAYRDQQILVTLAKTGHTQLLQLLAKMTSTVSVLSVSLA